MKCFFMHKWKAHGVVHDIYVERDLTPEERDRRIQTGSGLIETIVLMRCERCGDQKVNHLRGRWTLEQVQGKAAHETTE